MLRVKSRMLKDDNSVVKILYQVGPSTIRKDCLLDLIDTILDPHAFNFLRTKEQLGYSVGTGASSYAKILNFQIFVSSQESKNSYDKVIEKLEIFMNGVASKAIEELTDEDFEKVKQAKINLLDADDLDIRDEINRNWYELRNFDLMFNRVEVISATMKTLTKNELQEFFESFTQPENMRRLSTQVIGNKGGGEINEDFAFEFITKKLSEDEHLITDIAEFQENLVLYPVVDTTI